MKFMKKEANATVAQNVAKNLLSETNQNGSNDAEKAMITFDCCQRYGDTYNMVKCTKEWLDEQLDSPRVKQLVDNYQQTGDDLEYKYKLPVACFHSSFTDHHRCNESAVTSGLIGLDVDNHGGLDLNPYIYYKEMIEPRLEEDDNIVMVYVTPSGKGLRMVYRVPLGADILSAQQCLFNRYFAETWPADSFDKKCSDSARAYFLVPRSMVLYLDEDKMFGEALPAETENCSASTETPANAPQNPREALPHVEPYDPNHLCILPGVNDLISEDNSEYDGVNKFDIRNRLLVNYKMAGTKGTRNNQMLRLACTLSHICRTEAEVLSLMPQAWGLPQSEMATVVNHACRYLTPTDELPREIIKAVKYLKGDLDMGSSAPEMPANLPGVIKAIVAPFDKVYQPAFALTCLPQLGTLATNARFHYRDDKPHAPSFLAVLVASQANGKSKMAKISDMLLKDLEKIDKETRRKQQEIDDENLVAGDGKKTKNPHFFLYNIQPSTTTPMFYENMQNGRGKHCHVFSEELDDLRFARNGFAQNPSIFRHAFDGSVSGQMTKTAVGTTAVVPINLCLTMSCTPKSCKEYFTARMVENGTVGRTIFCGFPDLRGYNPEKDKKRTETNQKKIEKYIQTLRSIPVMKDEDDALSFPFLEKEIQKWADDKRELYLSTNNDSLDTFYKRSAVIGFRAGAIAYLAEEKPTAKDKKAAVEYAKWVAEYVLYYQMKIFGEDMEEQIESSNIIINASSARSTVNLMKDVPEIFTSNDLQCACSMHGMKGSGVRMQLSRWKQNGLITEVGKEGKCIQYKLTPSGIALRDKTDMLLKVS